MKLEGKITISRPQYGDGTKKISITIRDDNAGIRFLDLEMGYAEFTEAITGLSAIECEFEVRGLDKVGKTQEIESVEFPIGENVAIGEHKKTAIATAKKYNSDGWKADEYYGSQRSFYRVGEEDWARTTIRRWV